MPKIVAGVGVPRLRRRKTCDACAQDDTTTLAGIVEGHNVLRGDRRAVFGSVVEYIASEGYFIASATPDKPMLLAHPRVAFVYRDPVGYNAVRTPMDLPIAKDLIVALESARGPLIKLPTMGGSVPLEMIEKAVGAPTITVPIANYDNNQHSANENIRLQNLWDGIETMAALEAME